MPNNGIKQPQDLPLRLASNVQIPTLWQMTRNVQLNWDKTPKDHPSYAAQREGPYGDYVHIDAAVGGAGYVFSGAI